MQCFLTHTEANNLHFMEPLCIDNPSNGQQHAVQKLIIEKQSSALLFVLQVTRKPC